MAPKRQAKKTAASLKRDASTSSSSQDKVASQSQSFETQLVMEALKKKNEKVKKQQKQRERSMMDRHTAAMQGWREEAEAILMDYQRQIRAVERAKIERLIRLLQRKRVLQQNMDKSLAAMERQYLDASHKVCVTVDSRLRQLAAAG